MAQEEYGFQRDSRGRATLGGLPLTEILAAAKVGTPAYIYDLSGMEARVKAIKAAFGEAPHLIAYAVKANSAGSVVRTLTEAGAGVDAVSGGELLLARRCSVPARKIVLSGVAKRDEEIELAISEDILAVQAESVEELRRISERAKALGQRARVSLRLNPAVEIDSHSHIATGHDKAKFGVAGRDLSGALAHLSTDPHLTLVGLSTHVGSMLKTPDAYLKSARVVCDAAREARKSRMPLEYVDFGGGFGIDYGESPADPPEQFARAALGLLREQNLSDLMLVIEPGRSLVGSFGVLVSTVIQAKVSGDRRWVMMDAGMNDLLRPALYQARHRIEPVDRQAGDLVHRVVGPVCESTDDFGDYPLGDVPSQVVIRDSGAYSFVMASEYNGRPLPSEVFVKNGRVTHVSASPGVEHWIANRLRA